MKVLIVDEGRDRASVAAARALVATGWTVGAASSSVPNLASRSKAVAAWHHVPHTLDGVETFLQGLDDVVVRHGYDTAVVGWSTAVAAISKHRDLLSFPVGYGPHEGVMLGMDKERLAEVASRVGIAVPETIPAVPERLKGIDRPVIIKPALQTETGAPARRCATAEEAIEHVRVIEADGGRAIAQLPLDGALAAVSLVAGPDGIVTYAQQIAELTWPPKVGITARGRTVAVDPGLRAAVERLVEALQLQGLAHLQFLVPADGTPRLIDLNPRYYGSMALAIRAGANHPHAWACVATGRDLPAATARPGVYYQWFSRDLRASVASGQPAQVARFLSHGPRAAHSLWSPGEPTLAPRFLAEQVARRLRPVRKRKPDMKEQDASAKLHGVMSASPAVRRALRSRRVPPVPRRVVQRVAMKKGWLTYEERWLRPLQAARRESLGAAADGPPRFLVRVDEFPNYSGYDDPSFGFEASKAFHDVMAKAGVPHLMSVVPQWTHEPLRADGEGGRALDDRDRSLLDRMRADGVVFAQHGTTHRTVRQRVARGSELCGRSNDDLEALLERGRRQLAQVGVVPRVFVPPFNRFDASQWPVLARRYDVVTGGPESVMQIGFHGGPQWRGEAVYLPCYAPLYASAAAVLPAVRRLIENQVGTWIPVVLHMGWEVGDEFAALARLAELIAPYAVHWDEFLAAVDASRPR